MMKTLAYGLYSFCALLSLILAGSSVASAGYKDAHTRAKERARDAMAVPAAADVDLDEAMEAEYGPVWAAKEGFEQKLTDLNAKKDALETEIKAAKAHSKKKNGFFTDLLFETPEGKAIRSLEKELRKLKGKIAATEFRLEEASAKKREMKVFHRAGHLMGGGRSTDSASPPKKGAPVEDSPKFPPFTPGGEGYSKIPYIRFLELKTREAVIASKLGELDERNRKDRPIYWRLHAEAIEIVQEKERLVAEQKKKCPKAGPTLDDLFGCVSPAEPVAVVRPGTAGCLVAPPPPPLSLDVLKAFGDAAEVAGTLLDEKPEAGGGGAAAEPAGVTAALKKWYHQVLMSPDVDAMDLFEAFKKAEPNSALWPEGVKPVDDRVTSDRQKAKVLKKLLLEDSDLFLKYLNADVLRVVTKALIQRSDVTQADLDRLHRELGVFTSTPVSGSISKANPNQAVLDLMALSGSDPRVLLQAIAHWQLGRSPAAGPVVSAMLGDPVQRDFIRRRFSGVAGAATPVLMQQELAKLSLAQRMTLLRFARLPQVSGLDLGVGGDLQKVSLVRVDPVALGNAFVEGHPNYADWPDFLKIAGLDRHDMSAVGAALKLQSDWVETQLAGSAEGKIHDLLNYQGKIVHAGDSEDIKKLLGIPELGSSVVEGLSLEPAVKEVLNARALPAAQFSTAFDKLTPRQKKKLFAVLRSKAPAEAQRLEVLWLGNRLKALPNQDLGKLFLARFGTESKNWPPIIRAQFEYAVPHMVANPDETVTTNFLQKIPALILGEIFLSLGKAF